jgi:hypothetical protein
MGLLDDAIREHLELKRKHGAGEEELQRKETEALGPARRDFSAAAPAAKEAEAAPLPSDEAAPGYEPEPAPAEPRGWLDDDEPQAAAVQPAPAEPAPPEPVETPAPPPPEPAVPEPQPEPEPLEPVAEEPPARRTSDTPTQGFDALSLDEEEAEEEAPAEGSEDVLEETPDFLQDTPEHDRLWFEQKPPRDFDFDE